MNIDEVLVVVEQVLLSRQLNPVERLVFRQSWIGQTYWEIAQDSAYGSNYIKEIGSKLWNDLSDALGERVTKKNLHVILNQYRENWTSEPNSNLPQPFSSPKVADETFFNRIPQTKIEFPGRPVPLDSPLYIKRPPIEELACAEIHKPGCVLRIKAPQKMGKGSLVNRILSYAKLRGYQTVFLDFQEADSTIFTSLDKFLRWFCANISRQLQLTSMLDRYWDEDMGSKMSCKLYFQGYLLEAINSPLVLALNEVNRIFEHPEIARDFLPMLRSWHEQATQAGIWQKLRLIVIHSTEIYVPLKINQSPFNVGLALKVPEFNLEQVQELALRYGLAWADGDGGRQHLQPLLAMVGGHPYLVSLALYRLWQREVTLEQLLQAAPQPTGIYGAHLRSLLVMLQDDAPLAAALKRVVNAEESVNLEAIAAYKLESMGLIHLDGDLAKPSCQLYRLYFREHLGNPLWIDERLEQLEQKNRELERLSYVDELTRLANRRYFNQFLQTEWQQQVGDVPPLSLILCDVDYFKFYNHAHGRLAGDECLQRIAHTIRDCVQHRANVVARYGGEEFAVILPQTNANTAVDIAEDIRVSIKALAISYDNPHIGGLPAQGLTLSLGVASITPSAENSPEVLIAAADEALYQSKRKGRDRVTLFSASVG